MRRSLQVEYQSAWVLRELGTAGQQRVLLQVGPPMEGPAQKFLELERQPVEAWLLGAGELAQGWGLG